MKEDNHIDYFQLMAKYLSGNASDSEVKQLEEWVLSSPENKAHFNAFKKAWVLSAMEQEKLKIDVEQEWQSTTAQLFPEVKVVPLKKRPKNRIALFVRIAAAAAILLFASVWVFQYLNKADYLEVVAQNEVQEDQLPDGSQVSLNQFSTLKYLLEDDQGVRRAELIGDAFFEVERDTLRPFIITVQEVEIEVLGTAFYVDSREDQPQVQVIVQSGSVAVSSGTNKVILSANEIGIYDKASKQLLKKPNEDINYMAWKTDLLVFEKSKLESVVFDINRKFHAKISIENSELNTCSITTTFDHQSLEAVITIIEETLGISAERQGEEIVFTGDSCE